LDEHYALILAEEEAKQKISRSSRKLTHQPRWRISVPLKCKVLSQLHVTNQKTIGILEPELM
jgi:hypothetical protein